MIKHTMQEIADYFGMYVCIDLVRYNYINLFEEKPEFACNAWVPKNMYAERSKTISSFFVSDYDTHDWKILVKPKIEKQVCEKNYKEEYEFLKSKYPDVEYTYNQGYCGWDAIEEPKELTISIREPNYIKVYSKYCYVSGECSYDMNLYFIDSKYSDKLSNFIKGVVSGEIKSIYIPKQIRSHITVSDEKDIKWLEEHTKPITDEMKKKALEDVEKVKNIFDTNDTLMKKI